MNSVGTIKTADQDEKQQQEALGEILTTAIRNCAYPIDFSIYATCPRAHEFEQREPNVQYKLPQTMNRF